MIIVILDNEVIFKIPESEFFDPDDTWMLPDLPVEGRSITEYLQAYNERPEVKIAEIVLERLH